MIKYCFIKDEETGLVQLGAGCSDDYYEAIGMEKRDVKQSDIDFNWYLKEKCPSKTKQEKFKEAKEAKYQEALQGAYDFINYEAAYRFDEENSIEATDGNIGKFTGYVVGFMSGTLVSVTWTSKEDNVIEFTSLEEVQRVLMGLGAIQTDVWSRQFVSYKKKIEEATTIKEVETIEIDYKNLDE